MLRSLLALAISIALIIVTLPVHAEGNSPTELPASEVISGSYLVKLAPNAVSAAWETSFHLAAAMPQIGAQVIQTTTPDQEVLHALADNPAVLAFAPDAVIRPAGDTASPEEVSSFQWAPAKIQAPAAWSVSSGHDIVVAIVDSGIDPVHPDLKDRLVPGYNIWDDNANTADGCGHGTHVAGIVAAAADDTGVVGIAYQARLMPVKVMNDDCVGSYSRLVRGILYAVDHGATIIVITSGASVESVVLHDAVDYAFSRGVLVVAAAGNQASDAPFYPASYRATVAVAGTDQVDLRYLHSTFGAQIDLSAPAVSIYSTYVQDNEPVYAYMTGTSMAAPHVAGLAALVLAANPALEAGAVEELIKEHAVDLGAQGWDPYFGYGRIDALETVNAARRLAWKSDEATGRIIHMPLLLR